MLRSGFLRIRSLSADQIAATIETMKLGVPKESLPGENRVAIVPAVVPQLAKIGCEVLVERGAGTAAGFPDQQYEEKGAQLVDRAAALSADIVTLVRAWGAGQQPAHAFCAGQTVIAMCDPLGELARTSSA